MAINQVTKFTAKQDLLTNSVDHWCMNLPLLQDLMEKQLMSGKTELLMWFDKGIELGCPWSDVALRSDSGDRVAKCFAEHLQYPLIDCRDIPMDAIALDFSDFDWVRKGDAIPCMLDACLNWIVYHPCSIDSQNVDKLLGIPSSIVMALPSTWQSLKDKLHSLKAGQALTTPSSVGAPSAIQPSILPYAHAMVIDAMRMGCSDIHIASEGNKGNIRFRRHGLMQKYSTISGSMAQSLIACIKLLANCDVTEVRRPQDGVIPFERLEAYQKQSLVSFDQNDGLDSEHSKSFSFRASVLPGQRGEKMVLRLLNNTPFSLAEVGLPKTDRCNIKKILTQPQGLLVVSGPTGCGKTSTLHAMLSASDVESRHIISLEDPVEVSLEGVHQISINAKIGMDFSDVLPYVLRHDPDVLLVGEVRDSKTAKLVLSASQTGHLVLTSMHASGFVSLVQRFAQLAECQYETILSALSFWVEQRLIRLSCSLCVGRDCLQCHKGSSGRSGVFSCHAISGHISSDIGMSDMDQHSHKVLMDEALLLASKGKTSMKEVERVLGGRY